MNPGKMHGQSLAERGAIFEQRADGGRETAGVRLVAIGASAGGLEPLEIFFDAMPSDSGLAFVVIQHLSPDFKSLMNELLARHTKMPSFRVTDGMKVEADTIYLIPPRMEMVVEGGCLRLKECIAQESLSLPIDIFLDSLADERADNAICVILSGTGSDGTRGARAVRAKGGLVLVQDPQSAKFDGMPRSAIKAESASIVATPTRMPAMILAHLRGGELEGQEPSSGGDAAAMLDPVRHILDLLRRRHGPDFGYYKSSTVGRRIRRRVMLNHFNDLETYAQSLQKDENELNLLYSDLLIGVTAFFRDVEAFQSLEERVISAIAAKMSEDYQVRIWIAACASGEEAYSIAMMLADYARKHQKALNVKIFATDIHSHSLSAASVGLYSADKLQGLNADRIKRYFERSGDQYQVTPSLRRMIVFSQHNLLKDPPFTRMDLVNCRNLLIYFGDLAQRKALALFHFALRKGGCLFLGTSETPNDLADEFEAIDSKWRIYRKRRDVRLAESTHLLPTVAPLTADSERRSVEQIKSTAPSRNLLSAFSKLITRFTPPGFLLDWNGEVMHVFGDAHEYMGIGEGVFSPRLSEMVKPNLKIPVGSAVDRVLRHGIKVTAKNIRLNQGNDDGRTVSIVVEPLSDDSGKPDYIHVRFESSDNDTIIIDGGEVSHEQNVSDGSVLQARIGELEQDLRFTEESLQTTIEELETSNEELQATNEELMASNEELQSTNEELHSVNEELYTVSAEHQRKIEELTHLTDDMSNLLRSTDIGTVFVDEQLRIRKFTPAVAQTFNLVGHDIGRSIEHVTYRFQDRDLHGTIRRVISDGKPVERQVDVEDGSTYLMRVLPYRADEESIDGAVLTFVDVSEHLKAQSDLRRSEERYRSIYNNSPVMLHSIDEHGRIVRVSDFWLKILGYQRDEVIGRPAIDFLNASSRKQALAQSTPGLLKIGACDKVPFELQKKNGEAIQVLLSAIQSRDALEASEHSLAVLIDVTERNRAILELERSRERLSLALKSLNGGFFSVDCATGTFEASSELSALVGRAESDHLSFADWTACIHSSDQAKTDLTSFLSGATESDSTLMRLKTPKGQWMWVDCQRRLIRDVQGKPERVIGMIVDVTDLKQAEAHARQQTQAVSLANEELERFAHIVAHDLRSPLRGVKNLCKFLRTDLGEKVDDKSNDHLKMLDSQVEKMSHMLNDLLEYSLIEANTESLEETNVKKLVEEAAALVLPAQGFELAIADGIPAIRTDPTPLSLVFRNLIDNAVKHHDQSTGAIAVSAVEDGQFIKFSIIDDGPGIPEEFRATIFDFFKSLNPNASQGAAGMGLTFVKKAVLKQGGAVDVAGNPRGRGTRFTFSWPFEPLEAAPPKADKPKTKRVRSSRPKKI